MERLPTQFNRLSIEPSPNAPTSPTAASPRCTRAQILRNPWMEAVVQVAGQPNYGDVSSGVAARYLSPYWRQFKNLPIDERIQQSVNMALSDLARDVGPRVGPYSKKKTEPRCNIGSPRTTPSNVTSPRVRVPPVPRSPAPRSPSKVNVETSTPDEIDLLQPEIEEGLISNLPPMVVQGIQQGTPLVTPPVRRTIPPPSRGPVRGTVKQQALPPIPSGIKFTMAAPTNAQQLTQRYQETYRGGNVSSTGRISNPSNVTINNNV